MSNLRMNLANMNDNHPMYTSSVSGFNVRMPRLENLESYHGDMR